VSVSENWAADVLHAQVLAASGDDVLRQLAELHRPHPDDVDGMPTCRGCDVDGPTGADAVWPCRTYTLLARTALGIQDVEARLLSLRRG
jgi:hypothetical protein